MGSEKTYLNIKVEYSKNLSRCRPFCTLGFGKTSLQLQMCAVSDLGKGKENNELNLYGDRRKRFREK